MPAPVNQTHEDIVRKAGATTSLHAVWIRQQLGVFGDRMIKLTSGSRYWNMVDRRAQDAAEPTKMNLEGDASLVMFANGAAKGLTVVQYDRFRMILTGVMLHDVREQRANA